jgi:quinol monooxygenase YgiN
MGHHLTFVAEYTIKPGKLNDFRELVKTAFVPHFQSAEPGLWLYQWYENPEGSKVYQQSWYSEADDFVAHMKGALVSERFQRLLETCEVTRLEVFGNPGEAAAVFLFEHGLAVNRYFAGFVRNLGET